MGVPKLCIVVATGQNVANLAPLLELANAGDSVLWVESELAKKLGWIERTVDLLRKHGLTSLPNVVVKELNNPAELAKACETVAEQSRDQFKTVIIANGGLKLTPLGLIAAWKDQLPLVAYGNTEPANFLRFEDGIQKHPTVCRYVKRCLDLPEVLAASGYAIFNPSESLKIWPADEASNGQLQSGSYSKDLAFSRQQHLDASNWEMSKALRQKVSLSYDQVSLLLETKRVHRWKATQCALFNTAAKRRRDLAGHSRTRISDDMLIDDALSANEWRTLFHSTVKLHQDAEYASHKLEFKAPADRLGPMLENAVGSRVVGWLQKSEAHQAIVRSVWQNVKICRLTTPEIVAAEFDVLIALVNGVLLHIECKSFAVDIKDLDARLFNLHKASSQVAKMAVCGPLFTDCVSDDWFETMHRTRRRVESVGVPFLPLTIPGQPMSYSFSTSASKSEPHECRSFEDSLELFFKPYLP
jgi:hypothetical protein